MKLVINNLLRITVLLLLLNFTADLSAMPGPAAGGPPGGAPPAGSTTGGTPPCWSPPCVPIDGGIGILLAAGAFVGARKLYKGSRP